MIEASSIKSSPEPHEASGLEPRWRAAYVVARHEKVVAEELRRRCVDAFLPLYLTVHYWNKRRTQVELPLFPSYLFVRIAVHDQLRVLGVPGVVHIVRFNGSPAVVPEEEIEALRRSLALRRCQPHPFQSAGRRVRIISGPLMGLEGVVVRQQGTSRIIVSVDFIQRSVSVELQACDLHCLL